MKIDTEFNSAAQIHSKICVEAAIQAEQHGFSGVWKGESNSRDPLVFLSAIAAGSSTIELGTAIYHIYGRSPVTLATQAATLNEFSDGRLLLGLGVGNPVIAGWHGGSFDRPLARIQEYIEVLRTAYSGERVPDYRGEFYSTSRGFRLAFQPSHPLRIWMAGLGPQMSRLAGRLTDGIILNMANSSMISEIGESFRAGAQDAGRDPDALDVVCKVRVSLHEDVSLARAALKKVLTFYSLQKGYSDMLRRMGWTEVVDEVRQRYEDAGFHAAREVIPDEMIDGVPMYAGTDLSGLPEKLSGYAKAGATRCVVAYVPAGDDHRGEVRNFVESATFARDGIE